MFKPKEYSQYFRILDTSIEINSNSTRWMDSFLSHISLPKDDDLDIVDINVIFIECSENEVDEFLPLPLSYDSEISDYLELEYLMPFKVYMDGKRRWVDIPKVGRMWYDYPNGAAMSLYIGNSQISPLERDNLFGYNVLEKILQGRGFHAAHASCVKVADCGILFTGNSGAGKSTAAYALARKGHSILSDESILLNKNNEYTAATLTDTFKLRSPSVERFFSEIFNEKPLMEIGGELYYKAKDIRSITGIQSTALHYIMVINKSGRKHSVLEEIQPLEIIDELFQGTINCYDRININEKFLFLTELLKNVKCYRIHFGTDMDDFADKILMLAENRYL